MSIALDCRSGAGAKKQRRHRPTRPQLLTREQLDGRTGAAKFFAQLADQISADLGGRDQLSAIELALVEAFCSSAIVASNLNTRLLLGEPIDLGQHAQAVSAMVRVASRLGLSRRAKDVGPTLDSAIRRSWDDGDA
jgi:hypothetical protein